MCERDGIVFFLYILSCFIGNIEGQECLIKTEGDLYGGWKAGETYICRNDISLDSVH